MEKDNIIKEFLNRVHKPDFRHSWLYMVELRINERCSNYVEALSRAILDNWNNFEPVFAIYFLKKVEGVTQEQITAVREVTYTFPKSIINGIIIDENFSLIQNKIREIHGLDIEKLTEEHIKLLILISEILRKNVEGKLQTCSYL